MTTTLALLLAVLSSQAPPDVKSPLSPEESRKLFKVEPGLRVELVASEPQIQSPVAAAFDEEGRLFVVEMIDYPVADMTKPPLGRIKMLEDRDGDGVYRTSTVYADGLLMANGVMPWKGGILVTAAPYILWLKDSKGDGKADIREVLFEGFAAQNPQLRVSHPNFSIDNGIYVSNGQRGGKIRRSGRDGSPVVDIGGMDFRFDLVHDRYEGVTGFGQFGLTFDDWGERFVCTNRNHLIHLPIPNRYYPRNPFLAPPPPKRDDQGAGGAARVYPTSRNWTLTSLHSGTFTAACGVYVYRGSLLPEEFRGRVFTCEPTGNLVHMEQLTATGGSFDYKPPHEGVEFLTSPENWFRPVSMTMGPDGALYVIDFYRSEVEHPEWVPADLRSRYDFNGRKDLGRLWRVVPEKRPGALPRPHLGRSTTPELVRLLDHPDAWWRMTAQRLLIEREDRGAWGPLREMAVGPSPLGRLHAAWVLAGMNALDADLAVRLLMDPHPRVRENACRLAERWLPLQWDVQERLVALAGDPDVRVRFQAALSLGEWNSDAILKPLARIANANSQDRWTRLAVASSVGNRSGALIPLVEDPAMVRDLATIVGSRRDGAEVAQLLGGLEGQPGARRTAALNGLAEGMARRGTSLGSFLGSLPDEKAKSTGLALLGQAAELAIDGARPVPERLDALRLLIHVPWEAAEPPLRKLLEETQPQELRIAAVGAASAHKRPEVAGVLLAYLKKAMPALRREILEAVSRQPERLQVLLGEIEAKRLSGGDLGIPLVRQLVGHPNADLRSRAQVLLKDWLPEDRQVIIDRYKPSVEKDGDPKKGREIFRKNCTACHRIGDLGNVVGPDISDTLSKKKEQLLVDILDPSRVIDNNYVNYIVRTKSGAVLSGIISDQNASSLTLRRGEGQQDVVLRADIEEMKSGGTSLMPDGLEKNVSIEDMADLLTFLKGWRFIDAPERERRP
jgi:putative membrane-bound dehydrogenase-like protein